MKKLFTTVLVFITLLSYSQIDTNKTINLEECQIEAIRANDNTPTTFKNICKDELKLINNSLEPSFILSTTPSITVQSDAGSYLGYSYIHLRGIDQTGINATLDGMPLNEPEDFGYYFANIPDFLNSLSSLQIQRGIGISTNGITSYAGSINYETSIFRDSLYKLSTSYGSFNTYRLNAELGMVNKNKSLYISVSDLSSDGYKYHSNNASKSLFLNAGIKNKRNLFKFTLIAGRDQNNLAWVGVSDSVIKKDPKTNGDTKNETDDFFQTIMKINHTYSINSKSSISSCLYYNYLNGGFNVDMLNPTTTELLNCSFIQNFVGLFSNYTYRYKHINFYTGIHINNFERNHIGTDLITPGYDYNNTGYKNEYSAFTKLIYNVNFIDYFIDLSYRHTDFRYVGDVIMNNMNWNIFSPRVGLNFKLLNKNLIYYSIGRTEKEPRRYDLFRGENLITLNNINLEKVIDQELGIKVRNKNYFVNLNFYLMSFTNENVLTGLLTDQGYALHTNAKQSFRSGIELDMKYNIKNITFENGSCYSYNKIDSNNLTQVLTPSLIINQQIYYKYKKLLFGINGRYQSSSYIDLDNKYNIPEFLIFGCMIKYQLKNIDITLRGNNLTNQKYYTSGCIQQGTPNIPLYFIQAPINYLVTINYKF